MNREEELSRGQWLTSPTNRYSLFMQNDGNLALYFYNVRQALWTTNTTDVGDRLVMRSDGDLCVYDARNTTVWRSNTADKGASRLVVLDDGNLIVQSLENKNVLWTSNSSQSINFVYYFNLDY